MRVLGYRYCAVLDEAARQAEFFERLGLEQRRFEPEPPAEPFPGAVFPAGASWLEIWQQSADMPAGTMLQIVVDDADAMAATARDNGLEPQGPMDMHGERVYFVTAPDGLQVSFQSALASDSDAR